MYNKSSMNFLYLVDYYKLTIKEVIDSAPKIWRESEKINFDSTGIKLIDFLLQPILYFTVWP